MDHDNWFTRAFIEEMQAVSSEVKKIGLEFVKINGPVGARGISPDGRTVQVTQVKEMRPGETLNPFYIEVRGRQIGKHVIKARVQSFRSPQGVEAETDTTVNVSG